MTQKQPRRLDRSPGLNRLTASRRRRCRGVRSPLRQTINLPTPHVGDAPHNPVDEVFRNLLGTGPTSLFGDNRGNDDWKDATHTPGIRRLVKGHVPHGLHVFEAAGTSLAFDEFDSDAVDHEFAGVTDE